MPRGGHKIKPAKSGQPESSAPTSIVMKLTRRNTDWRASTTKSTFMSRNTSEPKIVEPACEALPATSELCFPGASNAELRRTEFDIPVASLNVPEPAILVRSSTSPNLTIAVDSTLASSESGEECTATSSQLPEKAAESSRPTYDRASSSQSTLDDETYDAATEAFDELALEETLSSGSSSYSRDSLSVFSSDSASIYSSASSVYSSGASLYSFDEDAESISDQRRPSRSQYQQRARPVATRRPEVQDAAARERSTLAKKAALFKNSRLPLQLPAFSTTLPAWSMICRAVHASADCYDSEASTRRGTYTPANTSKDTKAMIVDDQLIDGSRLIIVSIRGTQFKCLADWSVNKAADPVKPSGFFDDDENECHAGFLQVTKAMVGQVAAQLQQFTASSTPPSLLFTGHSAGGAVAAMLYSHMLSTSITSDLTTLADQFSSISCVTFGAPPLSLRPLPRREHGDGVFLSFANEGDPVLRLSNAAYVKSLVKLMTASPPSAAASVPSVKVVRHSRGTRVIRQALPTAPATPWEELPLWPTPPAPLTNAGDVILLRDCESGGCSASYVTSEELSDVIFGDLAQHTTDAYFRRIKDMAFAAMMGRNLR